jgi:hypothetical protein
MEKHVYQQTVLPYEVGRMKGLTDRERLAVVEALADVLRAAMITTGNRKVDNETR